MSISLYLSGAAPYIKSMKTAQTTLRTTTYSEDAEGYIVADHIVDIGRSPSGLRTFSIAGRQVAVQLPRGGIIANDRTFVRAEQIAEVRS